MTPLEFLRLRNSGDCSEELRFLRERNRGEEARNILFYADEAIKELKNSEKEEE